MTKNIEDKKWLISKMEKILEITAEDLDIRYQQASTFTNNLIQGFNTSRNIVMGLLGGIISIIFGFTAIERISFLEMDWALAITIGFGAIVFFSINFTKKLFRKSFQSIETSMIKAKIPINRLKLRVIDDTIDLKSIEYEKLEAFYNYVFLALGVTIVIIMEGVEKAENDAKFVKVLNKVIIAIKKELELGLQAYPKLYEMYHESLKKHGFLDDTYLEIIKPILTYCEENTQVKN